jgi:hypothetical protein
MQVWNTSNLFHGGIMNTHREIMQANIDKMVSERLDSTLRGFLPSNFTGDRDHALRIVMLMMQESTLQFFIRLDKRIEESERQQKDQREAVRGMDDEDTVPYDRNCC